MNVSGLESAKGIFSAVGNAAETHLSQFIPSTLIYLNWKPNTRVPKHNLKNDEGMQESWIAQI